MTITSTTGVQTTLPLATAGEAVAQLTSNKDAATQLNESKILSKYSNIVTGIQAQTQALKDSYICSLTSEQLEEVTPVLEKLGYTLTKGKSNASTGRTTITISWSSAGTSLALTSVLPNDIVGYLSFPYSTTFFPQGGTQPYTFTLKEGVLPSGLTLTTTNTTATLSGTPTVTGVDYFRLETKDSTGTSVVTTVTWRIEAVGGSTVQATTTTGITTVVGTTTLEGKLLLLSTIPPVSSIGQLGDKLGRVAIDANYIYYCIATYVTVPVTIPITPQPNIWKRVALTGNTWS